MQLNLQQHLAARPTPLRSRRLVILGSSWNGNGVTVAEPAARVVTPSISVSPKEQFVSNPRPKFGPKYGLKPVVKPSSEPNGKSTTRTSLMAGNWKLNPTSANEAKTLAALVASAARTSAADKPGFDVEVVVVPPFPFLPIVRGQIEGSPVKLGCQDIFPQDKGAFTGATSVGMVKSLGVEYVLVGHSERRTIFGETNADINAKVRAVLNAGLKPILCIGESKAEYEQGLAAAVCQEQLEGGLKGVSAQEMSKVVIAYEPVWAIGTGLTATPAIAQLVHAHIRKVIAGLYDNDVASTVRIQYGGSVTPESVDDLMSCPDIDGCLIGGASLVADKFARIFNFSPASSGPTRLWAREALPCKNVLGESPVWCSSRRRLYWVSAQDKELWEWDLQGPASKWTLPEVVGCVALREGGGLVLALATGVFFFNPDIGELVKVCDFEPELGEQTRPNDGRVDRQGNFLVGSYNNSHRQDGQEIGGLYRLSASDGVLREVLDYKHRCSNCISFTPDGSTVFFCDTPTRRIFAFDYNPTGGLSNRRLLFEMPSGQPGAPDGSQVDAQGYLWVALSGASQVVRISPEGRVDMVVELPVASPTSCTIGGPELDTLFITTRGPDGGALYSVKLPDGVRGLPEPEFKGARQQPGHASAYGGYSYGGSHAHAHANGSSNHDHNHGHSKYCDGCGAVYPRHTSRFCPECGTPRA